MIDYVWWFDRRRRNEPLSGLGEHVPKKLSRSSVFSNPAQRPFNQQPMPNVLRLYSTQPLTLQGSLKLGTLTWKALIRVELRLCLERLLVAYSLSGWRKSL